MIVSLSIQNRPAGSTALTEFSLIPQHLKNIGKNGF
jgi:hypothetical protein